MSETPSSAAVEEAIQDEPIRPGPDDLLTIRNIALDSSRHDLVQKHLNAPSDDDVIQLARTYASFLENG